jgi:hypothetical protein
MKKIEIVIKSNLEDIKHYMKDILETMKEHEEVTEYEIRERGKDECERVS